MLPKGRSSKSGRIINVKISEGDYKKLVILVERGEFMNISDAVRQGIRLLIEKYLSEVKEIQPNRLNVKKEIRERRLTKEEILKKIAENKEKIKEFGVKRIGLFGSYARNEQKEDSDVDIIVEFEEGKATYRNFLNLLEYLENMLGKKVDLLTAEGVKNIRIETIRRDIERSVVYVF